MDPSKGQAVTADVALEQILAQLPQTNKTSRVALQDAIGRITASAITAPINVPSFRNSAMDGYTFSHNADAAARFESGSLLFKEAGVSLAGHPFEASFDDDECIRITTGAMLPDKADTIIIKEDTEIIDTSSGRMIRPLIYPDRGEYVRDIGSNIHVGQTLCEAGCKITPAICGLLASAGISSVEIVAPLKVSLLSTGDELCNPDQPLVAGKIHDANRFFLRALLDSTNIEIDDLGIVADSLDCLGAALDRAMQSDILISSGGVSVGEADMLKQALASNGELQLWKILMKPGKPLTFGELRSGTRLFGLPGNPVSAMVTFTVFVAPAIRQMLGMQRQTQMPLKAICQDNLAKQPGRMELQRGIMTALDDGSLSVKSTGQQDSHILTSLAAANCLIKLPLESDGAKIGDDVYIIPLNNSDNSGF